MMSETEYYKKIEENKKLLDSLDLPKPEIGEDIWDYADRVEVEFKNVISVILPEDYDGNLFNYLDAYDLGDYLGDRFNMICEEEIRHIMI